jgi:hypothetical protein
MASKCGVRLLEEEVEERRESFVEPQYNCANVNSNLSINTSSLSRSYAEFQI